MARLLIDNVGNQIRLDRELGRGGEGAVYTIASQAALLAKVYHRPISGAKAQKLAAMVHLGDHDLWEMSAWPKTLLRETPTSPVIGFIMPRVEGERIHHLYGFTSRENLFPKADWRFLVHVARNVAAAMERLHSHGLVVGDINEQSFFVGQDARVRAIDCDSFQVVRNGDLWRCEVGVPTFTPPELQGIDLSKANRTVNHDAFGLAVLIFHLLFISRHPFAGKYLGPGEMSMERAIQECRFAYASWAAAAQMAPPPYALRLGHLPRNVASLFEKAFSPDAGRHDSRPRAREWIQSLDDLERNLKKCSHYSGHFFYESLNCCPWCEIVNAGGPNFFMTASFATVAAVAVSDTDVEAVWRRLNNITFVPPALPSPLNRQSMGIRPRPIPPQLSTERKLSHFFNICIAISITLIVGGIWSGAVFVVGLIALVSFIIVRKSVVSGEYHREVAARLNARRMQGQVVKAVEQRWGELAASTATEFHKHASRGTGLRDAIRNVVRREAEEITKLKTKERGLQLDHFLSRFLLADQKIQGIGPNRKAILQSYGIETAADIQEKPLCQISGFGPVLIDNLLGWRHRLEAKFVFNPHEGISHRDIASVQARHRQEKLRLWSEFRVLPERLAQCAYQQTTVFERLSQQLATERQKLAQIEADAEVR